MLNKRTVFICILLATVTLALYWPVRSFNFVDIDDNEYVTLNKNVQGGLSWKGVTWALQTYHSSNWHPVTWISHMLDCQVYGLNPAGHHLTNIIFHALNAALLFLLLLRMTGAMWPSCIVAALFAWHPAHVESVAWVAERKDVLSTFFGLLTLLAYVAYARQSKSKNTKSKIYYGLALIFFALGLMSKPMLVTLPFVLLLLDYWPLEHSAVCGLRSAESMKADPPASPKQRNVGLVVEKIPFFLMVIVCCWFTIAAQSASGAMKMNEKLSLPLRCEHALVAYVEYLKMMFWPVKLAFFYPHTGAPTMVHVVAALTMLLVITLAALKYLRVAPYFAVGWFWFLGTLVPVIGILQVGTQEMADRYTYFPSIGLFIAIAWGASQLWERWKPSRLILTCGATAALVACVMATHIQLQYWRDSLTLAEHARSVTEHNYVAYAILANAAGRAGKTDVAIQYAKTSVEYKPDYYQGHYFLGLAYLETGQIQEASAQLAEAAQLRPESPMAHQKLGRVLVLRGRIDDAFEEFSTAAKLDPSDSVSETMMGVICASRDDDTGAIKHYQAALAVDPDSIQALNNFALIRAMSPYQNLRNGAEAVRLAKRACDATHDKEASLLGTLAAAYAEAGDFTNAVAMATKARDLALATNKRSIADRNEKLLELYRNGQAYHEGGAR